MCLVLSWAHRSPVSWTSVRFWFCTSGMGTTSLHFWLAPRWHWCCLSMADSWAAWFSSTGTVQHHGQEAISTRITNLWVTLSVWPLCKACGVMEGELSRSCLTFQNFPELSRSCMWNGWVCFLSLSGGALGAVPRQWSRLWSTGLGSPGSSSNGK